jgi:flagellar hook-associated protein 1 FlgK
MRSSFFEFTVANSALFTARANLDVTGHNVANATTRGFSRQVVEQRAQRPLALGTGRGMVGTGSEVYGITQMRDFFLDRKFWNNIATLGQFTVKSVQLNLLENTLDEMAGSGLKTQFDRFFNLNSDLTTAAGQNTYRMNLLQHGDFITTQFGNTFQKLQNQQIDVNEEIRNVVSIINSKASQIASLNQQILRAEMNGNRANDLRDMRALLIDELSAYVNVEVSERELNPDYEAGLFPEPEDRVRSHLHFTVNLNGTTFIDGSTANLLRVEQRRCPEGQPSMRNAEDMPGLYDIYWDRLNIPFNMYSPSLRGELRGLIDIRDGNNQNHVTLREPANGVIDLNDPSSGSFFDPVTGRMNIEVPPGQRPDLSANGSFTILQNGRVREYFYKDFNIDDLGPPFMVSFEVIDPPNGPAFNPNNITEIKIGAASTYKGIPYYLSRLNTMARTVAYAVNEGKRLTDDSDIPDAIGHRQGHNLAGQNLDMLFFTFADHLGNQIESGDFNIFHLTAANIKVNQALLLNPALLQGAQEPPGTGGVDDNRVLLSWRRIEQDRGLFTEGSLGDFINSIVGELGIDRRQADSFTLSYTEVTIQIDNQRMSISGVDIDEEMVSLIRHRQLFQAAANLINAIDRIYDTLINRLGSF